MSVAIRVGHVVDVLRSLDPDSVQCVVTSVPYWGLRSYKTEPQVWGGNPRCVHFFEDAKGRPATACMFCGAWRGEHGLEPALEMWIGNEVLIWREIMRVLRKDGVAFLNCGDAYAGGGRGADTNSTLQGSRQNQVESRVAVPSRTSSSLGLLRAKQRLMLPARLALALQADGWFLRDEIVWHKPNPMPSSVKDRTTPAHEMIYVLAKRARYFWDADAIAEPFSEASIMRLSQANVASQPWGARQDQYDIEGYINGSRRPNEIVAALAQKISRVPAGWDIEREGAKHSTVEHNQGEKRGQSRNGTRQIDGDARNGPESGVGTPSWEGTTRNKRSVWTIQTEPFADAHFATFPTRLVEPMILAATSAKGACARCGAPWARVTSRRFQRQPDVSKAKGVRGAGQQKPLDASDGRQGTPRGATIVETLGWEPTCKCTDAGVRPCIVMDPFLGSGTTALVADRLGRDCVGIELNPSYAEMAKRRVETDAPLLLGVALRTEQSESPPLARVSEDTSLADSAP